MVIDLNSMSRAELEKHLEDVKKALQNAQERDRQEARKAAEKAAAEFGFSLDELAPEAGRQGKSRKAKGKGQGAKSKPQFANPADPSQTWTGKGRQPNWYRAEIAKGTDADAMRL